MSEHRVRVSVSGVVIRDRAILLVAYDDAEAGFHYNLPGGGVERGESLAEALRREMREEASADVLVGPLISLWEDIPERRGRELDVTHTLGPVFHCEIAPGSEPVQPASPDPNQVGVHWIALADLPAAPLLPPPTPTFLAALQTPQDAPIGCAGVWEK